MQKWLTPGVLWRGFEDRNSNVFWGIFFILKKFLKQYYKRGGSNFQWGEIFHLRGTFSMIERDHSTLASPVYSLQLLICVFSSNHLLMRTWILNSNPSFPGYTQPETEKHLPSGLDITDIQNSVFNQSLISFDRRIFTSANIDVWLNSLINIISFSKFVNNAWVAHFITAV